MLEVTGLTAGYHGGTVLHGLDLSVPAGTVHAVVGHNGAGKTTLVHSVVDGGGGRVVRRAVAPLVVVVGEEGAGPRGAVL
ncbi:ATP-binding cassette domain-containing protein, partial [Streptomyces albidoflavus]|uniref:ATP-binding cassette domain-containing protein n=1 Tax=Streptomyces albidoflavus TaxID=1886 RepID=UPI00342FBA52